MFTEFDVFVCVIVVISTIMSFLRGFVKDFLGIVGWWGAAGITLVFYPYAASYTESLFRSSWLISVAAVIIVYIIALMFLSIINSMIIDNLREFRMGPVDRSFGMLFGLFKGLVIISVLHFTIVTIAGNEPAWLKEGETFGLTEMGSDIIEDMFGDFIRDRKEAVQSRDSLLSKELEEEIFKDY